MYVCASNFNIGRSLYHDWLDNKALLTGLHHVFCFKTIKRLSLSLVRLFDTSLRRPSDLQTKGHTLIPGNQRYERRD